MYKVDEDIYIDEDEIDPEGDAILKNAQNTILSTLPKPIWECNWFGTEPGLVFVFEKNISLWKRIWMHILLGSTFRRIKHNDS